MTYETVTVVLSQHEMGRLRALAQRELRKPKDQAAYLLRNVLQSEGLEKVNSAGGIRQDNPSTVVGVNS